MRPVAGDENQRIGAEEIALWLIGDARAILLNYTVRRRRLHDEVDCITIGIASAKREGDRRLLVKRDRLWLSDRRLGEIHHQGVIVLIPLVVTHREGDGVIAKAGEGVIDFCARRKCPIAKIPAPPGNAASGIPGARGGCVKGDFKTWRGIDLKVES